MAPNNPLHKALPAVNSQIAEICCVAAFEAASVDDAVEAALESAETGTPFWGSTCSFC